MGKSKMKSKFCLILIMLCISCISQVVRAQEDVEFMTEAPDIYYVSGLENGKVTITVRADKCFEDSFVVSYEMELSQNENFNNAQQYHASTNTFLLDKSVFGKNGGKFYVRVRRGVQSLQDTKTWTSDWSNTEEVKFVKINKVNFPGMYEILKNGGKHSTRTGAEKLIYDINKDGWLDQEEIDKIWMIGTLNESKKVNGVYKFTKAPNISGFKGIEYFHNLHSVYVARYSGKKADFSKSPVKMVDIRGISAKQITVIAPNAENVMVEADYNNKMTKIDLSKCGQAVEIYAYGNESTKNVKLPKAKKNLKILSVSEIGIKNLDVNKYTNLQQLYVYDSDMTSVKVNKCKDLRYIYFWYCYNIRSLDLKSNNKLRGADFYKTPGLTSSTVKKSKSGKYTWNKGKWWYSTSAYKKDMKKIYQ